MNARRSLDDLFASQQQTGWHIEAQCFGGLQIDDKLKLSGLNNWQLGRLRTVEDLPRIDAGLAKAVRYIGPAAHQSADFDTVASGVGRWNPISCRQGDELNAAEQDACAGLGHSPLR